MKIRGQLARKGSTALAVATMAVAVGGCAIVAPAPQRIASETPVSMDRGMRVSGDAPRDVLPAALLPVVVESLGDSIPESYAVVRNGETHLARNAAHGLAFRFDGQALEVAPEGAVVGADRAHGDRPG